MRTYRSLAAILAAVADQEIPAGYVISTRGPWLAQQLAQPSSTFCLAIHATAFQYAAAVRTSDKDLQGAIDKAVTELAESGKLAAVFAKWRIPRTRRRLGHGAPSPIRMSMLAAAMLALIGGAGVAAAEISADQAEGQALFRGLCSGCHGGAGRGGKGPDLTDTRWIHGDKDADIARVIRDGVPKTTMKKLGESLKEEQIAKLILYIRSLARSPGESTWKPYLAGDPAAGRKLFFDVKGKAPCAKCHTVDGEGGRIGPALDRIASRRRRSTSWSRSCSPPRTSTRPTNRCRC